MHTIVMVRVMIFLMEGYVTGSNLVIFSSLPRKYSKIFPESLKILITLMKTLTFLVEHQTYGNLVLIFSYLISI